jgi:hypothetical protein
MNLNQMETEFIAIPTVKEGLKLSDKSRLDTKIKNANKKSFALSLEKVTLVTNAIQWLKSDEGQRELNEIGLHWTQEDLAEKVFETKRNQLQKYARIGRLDERVIETFIEKCNSGEIKSRSINELDKFGKIAMQNLNNVEVSEDATSEEVATAQNEALNETEMPTETEIIGGAFVIIDGRKISFKVDSNMDIVCRNADNIELVKSFINGVCERHTNNN